VVVVVAGMAEVEVGIVEVEEGIAEVAVDTAASKEGEDIAEEDTAVEADMASPKEAMAEVVTDYLMSKKSRSASFNSRNPDWLIPHTIPLPCSPWFPDSNASYRDTFTTNPMNPASFSSFLQSIHPPICIFVYSCVPLFISLLVVSLVLVPDPIRFNHACILPANASNVPPLYLAPLSRNSVLPNLVLQPGVHMGTVKSVSIRSACVKCTAGSRGGYLVFRTPSFIASHWLSKSIS